MEADKSAALGALRSRSWEMELLLSGFVLVLLLPVPKYIRQEGVKLIAATEPGLVQQFFSVGYLVCLFGARVLITNLVIYLLLRGFWVGLVGLTTAFPEGFDVAGLGYHERFTRFLSKRAFSTGEVVRRLNVVCSTVFSFSFMVVFLNIAFFGVLFLFTLLLLPTQNLLSQYPEDDTWGAKLEIILMAVFFALLVPTLAVLFDFLTLGTLKRIRKRWFVRIYFPVYRFFRYVTLAPVYATIYYTLIGNVSRRLLAALLLTYLGVFYALNNYAYSDERYFPPESTRYEMQPAYYQTSHTEDTYPFAPFIPSEYVEKDLLRVFIPYHVADNDTLAARCGSKSVAREQPKRSGGFSDWRNGRRHGDHLRGRRSDGPRVPG